MKPSVDEKPSVIVGTTAEIRREERDRIATSLFEFSNSIGASPEAVAEWADSAIKAADIFLARLESKRHEEDLLRAQLEDELAAVEIGG